MQYALGIDEHCVVEAGKYMMHHTHQFITPVAQSLNAEDSEGRVIGSGSFLSLRGKTYILTNEHVACHMSYSRLSFFQEGGVQAAAIIHPFQCWQHPVDAAVSRIDEDLFAGTGKKAITSKAIAPKFDPREGEIFFIHGYPGVQARWSALFGGIMAKTFPYATAKAPLPDIPEDYDPEYHFALEFPDDIWRFGGRSEIRPDPRGLSGSIVWDTGYVAAGANRWSPSQAKICGLVWAFEPKNQCLVATKIEHVRTFLLSALRHEAAYFRWLTTRKCVLGDPLPDWLWAEQAICDLG